MPQLLKNILSSYLGRMVAIAAEMILLPVMAYYLGLETLGAWLVIQNAVVLFLRSDLGVGAATMRYVALYHGQADSNMLQRTVSSSFVFLSILAVGVTPIFLLGLKTFWDHLDGAELTADLERAIWTVSLGMVLCGLPLSLFRSVLAGLQRYDLANYISVGETLARAACIAGVLALELGILAVAVVDTFVFIFASIAAWRVCTRLDRNASVIARATDWQLLRSMLPYSLQLSAMTMLGFLILATDSLVVGSVVSVSMVPVYAAGMRIFQGCRELTAAMVQSFIPDAARSSALQQKTRLALLYLRGTKVGLILALGLCIPTAAFAQPLVAIWVGSEFSESVGVARILLVGLVVGNLHLVSLALLKGIGEIRSYLWLHCVWAAANLALSVLLGSRFGIVGVALGTTLPVLFLEPFYIAVASKKLEVSCRVFIQECLLAPLACASVASLPILLYLLIEPDPGALAMVIGSLVFALLFLVLVMKFALNKSERAAISDVLMSLSTLGRSAKSST